jgi:VCBS repeat-containing protein
MAIQFDNTNTGVATLKPATSGTLTLTLPSADGTTGQAITTDGAGQLAFTTVGGGGGTNSPKSLLDTWMIGAM